MFVAMLSAYLITVPPAGESLSPQTQHDLQTLGWKWPIDGRELLKRIRFQTLTRQERLDAEASIERLASSAYRDREKAMRDLMYANPGVDPLLRARLQDADAETRRRLEQMLRVQRGRWSAEKAEATIRLVRETRPEGAAEVLLAFLPYADDRAAALEAVNALRALGIDRERFAKHASPFAFENDELPPAEASRQIAQRFFDGLAVGNHDDLRVICALPFLVGSLPLESDAELNEVFEHGAAGYKADGKMLEVSLGAVHRGDGWLAKLPESDANAVRRLANDRIRAVEVRIRVDSRHSETGYILIDTRSDGPRVVGLLDATRSAP